jgi:creatinine amidohydrolase/Fe(II)-dependent formamide hydrolase-like protein
MIPKSLLAGALATLAVAANPGLGQAQTQTQAAQNRGGGNCANNPYNCADTPNPLPKANTVWLEEMTWMDVRDAMKAGMTTIIITTGGIEPNGPWLALGKHNYVLRANCEAIARKLGNALCAPIDPFVPEGDPAGRGGHMATAGTISLREETFQALLTDIVTSLKTHGFENIVLIGDSGGNTTGMRTVATRLNTEWSGKPFVVHIPQYYDYASVSREMAAKGLIKEGTSDQLHDDAIITLNMWITDPKSVRYDERVKAGKATINGVSIADAKKNMEMAKAIVEYRATVTVDAIKAAMAAKK